MRKLHVQSRILAAVAVGAASFGSRGAMASNPLEYPDNGSAAFSRGGAWLATANEPIAAHYNPAALATQGSGFSIEQQLNFDNVCFNREGPNGAKIGPDVGTTAITYLPVCQNRGSFPATIPSISIAWRATAKLGFGFSIVPPATYGTPLNAWPATSLGNNTFSGSTQQVAAPYRYMSLNQQSTILFPTLSVGYEVLKHFRVGAGFVSGLATIDTQISGIGNGNNVTTGDHFRDDVLTTLQTNDLFVPGVVGSIHWSVTPQFDVSLWGRWMDSVRSSKGIVTGVLQPYTTSGSLAVACPAGAPASCPDAQVSQLDKALTQFVFPIPPELRLGVRFHQPRTKAVMLFDGDGEVRDPLHDDLFDVELDGSYAMNSKANTVQVRFAPDAVFQPIGVPLPPNADRWNGYIDSYGLRLGGQWNVIQSKLGIRAGGWMETRSVDPAWLNVFPVGAFRYGMGGGIVFRQNFVDISLGFQHHESQGLDNGGNGLLRASIGANPPTTVDPPGATAATRTAYRTVNTVNGGQVTQSANAFTLGGTVHF